MVFLSSFIYFMVLSKSLIYVFQLYGFMGFLGFAELHAPPSHGGGTVQLLISVALVCLKARHPCTVAPSQCCLPGQVCDAPVAVHAWRVSQLRSFHAYIMRSKHWQLGVDVFLVKSSDGKGTPIHHAVRYASGNIIHSQSLVSLVVVSLTTLFHGAIVGPPANFKPTIFWLPALNYCTAFMLL